MSARVRSEGSIDRRLFETPLRSLSTLAHIHRTRGDCAGSAQVALRSSAYLYVPYSNTVCTDCTRTRTLYCTVHFSSLQFSYVQFTSVKIGVLSEAAGVNPRPLVACRALLSSPLLRLQRARYFLSSTVLYQKRSKAKQRVTRCARSQAPAPPPPPTDTVHLFWIERTDYSTSHTVSTRAACCTVDSCNETNATTVIDRNC